MMNTKSSIYLFSRQRPLSYWICTCALFTAIALSLISWLRLCSQACAEGHAYRLFGFTFEAVGLASLPLLMVMHLLSRQIPILSLIRNLALAAMLGAEVMFIYVQKYMIGSWCPICLAIAASLLIAALPYVFDFCKHCRAILKHPIRGNIMFNMYKGFAGIGFFFIGFLFAFSGIGKDNQLMAAENTIKENIAFGNLNSPIQVFIFTDWECPACRALEPTLNSFLPKIMPSATVTFVDDPVHAESLNFTPYNVSFMIHNKAKYLELRHALTLLSMDTRTPTEEQIAALAVKQGQRYQQLNYADVALANKYFTHLVDKLDIEGTPTVVVVNKQTQKGKKLPGSTEITEENVLKAIETLSK
ncbi:MAG: thioredoxin domain-containing protein [Parachlamydiaceae bacterium]